jgi:hypothetical protein
MDPPRTATVIAVVFGVSGINVLLPTGDSFGYADPSTAAARIGLAGLLVCAAGLVSLRPEEVRRGTEDAPSWVLLLAVASALLIGARVLLGV